MPGSFPHNMPRSSIEHEERGLPYLFKLRHTPKVKELVVRMMRQGAFWQDCGDGWQALETTIRLSGWTRERRIVLVRESPARAPVARIAKPRRGKDRQNFLPKTRGEGWDAQATPWSGKISVITTTLDPIEFATTVIVPPNFFARFHPSNLSSDRW
jgi:hypothetical protein